MKIMKQNQTGFGHVGILLLVIVVALAGFVGWRVWHNNQKDTSSAFDCPINAKCDDVVDPGFEGKPPKDFPTVKEWGVNITFPSMAKAQYWVTGTKDPSINAIVGTMQIFLKDQGGKDCQALGVYLLRTPKTSDKGLLVSTVGGYKYYLQGDQAGCMDFPLRDKIAEELKTAKIESLAGRKLSSTDGNVSFLIPNGWVGAEAKSGDCLPSGASGKCISNVTFTDSNKSSTYAYVFKTELSAADWYAKAFGKCNEMITKTTNDNPEIICKGVYGPSYTVSSGRYVVYFRGQLSDKENVSSGFLSIISNLKFE